jgi:hypothetical protein
MNDSFFVRATSDLSRIDKEQADKIETHLKSMSQSVFGSVQVSLSKCPRILQNDKAFTPMYLIQVSTVDAFQVISCVASSISRVNVWCAYLSIIMIGRGEASHCPLHSQDEPKQLHRQPTENKCCSISRKKVNRGVIYEERSRNGSLTETP